MTGKCSPFEKLLICMSLDNFACKLEFPKQKFVNTLLQAIKQFKEGKKLFRQALSIKQQLLDI